MGAPLSVAVNFAVSAVTGLASYFLTTKEIEGPRVDTSNAPTSTYGQNIPTIYGRTRVAGNLIWTKKIREERKDGNKLKGIPSEYKYYGTFAVLLCEGVVDVTKIWANGKLVYDFYNPSGETQIASSKFGQYIKIYRGTADQQPDPTIQAIEGANRTPAFKGKAYIVFNDLPLKEFNSGIPTISCEVIQSENPLLSDIVTNLCLKAGIPPEKIDASELSDKVSGLLIPNSGESYKDTLDELAKAYFFYCTINRENNKLIFRKIQRPITSVNIPFGELGTREFGNEKTDNYKKIRVQESELPTSLAINFKNPNLRYNSDTQIALTQKEKDTNSISLDFNLSLYRTEARFICLILLHQFWMRRNRYEEITLSPKWINAILPGDLITIPINENTNATVQVESVDIGANYQVDLKCVEYEGQAFSPPPLEVEEEIRYEFISDPSSYGSAILHLLDIPIFDDRGLEAGAYAVAESSVSNWKNGNLYRSLDFGNSYQELDSIYAPSACGITNEALRTPRRTDVIDYASELTVTLSNANLDYQLFSSTDLAFLNGEVLALIGNEIVAFKNAILIEPLVYKLSEFIRGMFNTETEINNHQAGERFILLKGNVSATNIFFPMDMGQTGVFKLQSSGETIELVPPYSFTYEGALYRLFDPFDLKHSYNSDGLIVEWKKRTTIKNFYQGSFDLQFFTLSEIKKLDIGMVAGFLNSDGAISYSLTYEQLASFFGTDDSFIFKVRERLFEGNSYSNWVDLTIPIEDPYIYDESENLISDEDGNLLLHF